MGDDYIPDDDDKMSDLSAGSTDDLEERINTVDVNNIDEEIEIQDESSQLASTPGKNILILLVLGIASIYFIYNTVFKKDPAQVAAEAEQAKILANPVQNAEIPVAEPDRVDTSVSDVLSPELPDFDSEGEVGVLIPQTPGGVINSEVEPEDESPFSFKFPSFGPKDESDKVEFDPRSIGATGNQLRPPSVENNIFTPPTVNPDKSIVDAPNLPVTTGMQLTPGGNVAIDPTLGPSAEEIAAMESAKRRQPMLLSSTKAGSQDDGKKSIHDFMEGLSIDDLEETVSDKVNASLIGNTDVMIAQGKMIDVVLETAINTDLDGLTRAVVSRDVYAESGRSILIPKGSRLIGRYSNDSSESSDRVLIVWNRVIRPDGIDVQLESPGTDRMGRSGISGFVDRRYFDILSNAFLLSAVSIAGSIAVDKIDEQQQQTTTTTTTPDGNTTTSSSGTATDAAVLASVNDFSDIAAEITQGLLNDDPIIIIQQGTKMKVFVNRDVHFPNSVASNVRFIR